VAKNCKALQYSDQMLCGACGLAWDVNDEDPPECKPVARTALEQWREEDRKRTRDVLPKLRGPT